jgi:hypothetical protein
MTNTPSDKEIDQFFNMMRDMDSNFITIKEFENHIKKVQGTFSEME